MPEDFSRIQATLQRKQEWVEPPKSKAGIYFLVLALSFGVGFLVAGLAGGVCLTILMACWVVR